MNFVARIVFLVGLVVLAACPRQTRKTLVPDVPTSGDQQARSRFTDAKARFEHDEAKAAEFRAISEQFPNDPIRPHADLMAGIAALKERKFDVAEASLTAAQQSGVEGLTTRAELFLGIVANYRGQHAKALPLLKKGERAVENDAERTEFLGALAYATAAGDQPLQALAVFDALYTRVTPPEKAMIVSRVSEIVAAADPNALGRAFDGLDDRKGPSTAVAAARLSLIADQAGNASEAEKLREIAGTARVAVGLPRSVLATTATAAISGSSSGGGANLVGAVVPLGGKQNKVAEAAVAGLGLAAGVTEGKGVAAVEVRAAQDADASALAVEELARANAVAIVGPIDSASVDAAGAKADALGIPLLSLSTAAEKAAPAKFVFHMVHSGEARSRALARAALGKGIKKFAVLSAENGYGRAMSSAFTAELAKGGGTVVKAVTYKADIKSFSAIVGQLSGDWDAIFIPAQADTLGLIAPALAASGKVPKPVGTKKLKEGRGILLLSTAENLTGAYIIDAGRHTTGALLAPGYYPDDKDPASKAFLDRFIVSFGRAPGFLEAYAYDAANLAAAGSAIGGRAGLTALLNKGGELPGLTGAIRFDADHRRADPGVLYTVVEESGAFAIRVAR